jgi:phosphomevalonate kinase
MIEKTNALFKIREIILLIISVNSVRNFLKFEAYVIISSLLNILIYLVRIIESQIVDSDWFYLIKWLQKITFTGNNNKYSNTNLFNVISAF